MHLACSYLNGLQKLYDPMVFLNAAGKSEVMPRKQDAAL
jgi:hypothetical protein